MNKNKVTKNSHSHPLEKILNGKLATFSYYRNGLCDSHLIIPLSGLP